MPPQQVLDAVANAPRAAEGAAIRATRTVLTDLFGPDRERPFAVRLWDGTVEPAGEPAGVNGAPPYTFVLRRPGALRRMLLPPSELSIVQAYISGDVDIEGDLEAAIGLSDAIGARLQAPKDIARLLPHLLALPTDRSEALEAREQRGLRRRGPLHSPERDAVAVRFHYDVGNDFYALWLDRNMAYSCAYFQTGTEDLAAAQEAKFEHICRKLRLQPGERLLDIGCGWGGLIAYAARCYGVTALGITLSPAQAELARARIQREGLEDRCRVEIRDYRTLQADRPFDKIASVGMSEHVGEGKLPEYFAAGYRALEPGGLFLNHCIVTVHGARPISAAERLAGKLWRRDAFITRYVFPDGKLVPLSLVIASAESMGFEVRDVESLREHYALTLRAWVRRLEAQRDRAVELVGEATYRVWRLYMAAAAHQFTEGSINIVQTLLAKPERGGRSGLPLTREYLYRT